MSAILYALLACFIPLFGGEKSLFLVAWAFVLGNTALQWLILAKAKRRWLKWLLPGLAAVLLVVSEVAANLILAVGTNAWIAFSIAFGDIFLVYILLGAGLGAAGYTLRKHWAAKQAGQKL